jgi:hypothetical protein
VTEFQHPLVSRADAYLYNIGNPLLNMRERERERERKLI